MKEKSTIFFSSLLTGLLLLLFIGANAQQFRVVESGNYISALTKDSQGTMYAAKYNSGSDRYDVVKMNIHDGTSSVIYAGLQYKGPDYPWGLAVDSHGNVFVAASNLENKVIKLSFNSGTNTYTPSDFMAGNFITALATDDNDNLYVAEYYQPTNKYRIVRYAAGANSGGTILYDNINIAPGYTYIYNIVVAPNHDVYFAFPFGATSDPDQGKVVKLSAADNYATSTTISSGKYSTAIGLDEQGNLFVSEYDAASSNFVLDKYTGAAGTPRNLYTLENTADFFSWGIAVFNSQNIYFTTGSSTINPGGALVQLYAAPVSPATDIIASEQTTTSAKLKWTNGTGSRRLVFMEEGNAGIPTITNSSTYTANSVFGSGATDQSGSWYCVYDGNNDSVVVSGLQADHTYRAMVIEYNGATGTEQYQTATAANNPINFSAVSITSIVRADPDSTYASTLHYTVTFGSGLTGLSPANFSLSTTGYLTGSSIVSTTATNATTYDVEVHRDGGPGELTLNLATADGLTAPLVSTLPFAGQTYHLKTHDVDLIGLQVRGETLSPTFSTDDTIYTVTAHSPAVIITPMAANLMSHITVNGQPVASGAEAPAVLVGIGETTIPIVVTSPTSNFSRTYKIVVTFSLPLPVTWVDFEVEKVSGKYAWNWKLGVESQISHYVAQYSTDGIHYQDAGTVTEKNSAHQYHFSKELNNVGLIYFRVMAVDNDGSKSYSAVKTLNSDAKMNGLIVYPNPVSNELHIKWPDTNSTSLDVAVYDAAGKKVIQHRLQNAATITLPVGGLAGGAYYLVVEDNQHRKIQSGKFLKK